jgi:preprotein translocase subunit YajC
VSELASLLPFVGIALLFWLLMIRPAQRRQRVLREMQSELAVGDEVMLTSGIFATVHEVGDDKVSVQVAPGVVLSVVRGAIGSVLPQRELSTDAERSESDTHADPTADPTEER